MSQRGTFPCQTGKCRNETTRDVIHTRSEDVKRTKRVNKMCMKVSSCGGTKAGDTRGQGRPPDRESPWEQGLKSPSQGNGRSPVTLTGGEMQVQHLPCDTHGSDLGTQSSCFSSVFPTSTQAKTL